MDLSIIIPVYNTSIEILERCLNTILKITNIKYEIIIVDDGSIKKLSTNYDLLKKDNILIFHKENEGVSSARNYGIEKASGKYIMFVDSDDILMPEKIDYELFYKDFDIIFYNLSLIKNDTFIENNEVTLDGNCIINCSEVLKDFVENDSFYSPVAKFINKKFLEDNKIKFNTQMINGEDAIFNLDMLLCNPKLYYNKTSIYGYYYEISNYEKRICNKFENTLSDYLYKYNRKKDIIKIRSYDEIIVKKIENKAVDQIFRICLICADIKKNCKNEMSDYMKKFNINYHNLTFKNKIRYKCVSKRIWIYICIMSRIRKIYLKIKKTNA